ncbi:MAG TPA: hypothetical protein VGJ67_06080 [Actinomycetota bacterium]|jgi:hypothetical protein
MTQALDWLNTTTFLNISVMAWIGILFALALLAVATVVILFLVLLDGRIGRLDNPPSS